MNTSVDFIGDIHGHAAELKALLKELGYRDGTHPDGRTVVFLGDYVDRGPSIKEVLETVSDMTNKGSIALMGNHELNAILYQTPTEDGFLRPHTEVNTHQQAATLEQLGKDLGGWLPWISARPIWFTNHKCQAIHACWDQTILATRFSDRFLTKQTLPSVAKKAHPINILLKGLEIRLPEGQSWEDRDGITRYDIRAKWWMDPTRATYADVIMPGHSNETAPDVAIAKEHHNKFPGPPEIPTFIGHYWLKEKTPSLLHPKLACLDYSVAKGGFLCAYRFDGETTLNPEKFVYVH